MTLLTALESQGGAGGGGVLLYLGMVGKFCNGDPRFWDFRSNRVSILCLITIWLTPSFYRKIVFSLSHLVSEILGPNVGQIFHQNVLFNSFYVFCITFLLDFRSIWPRFSLILDRASFLQNLRSDGFQFFITCQTR